MSRKVEIGMQYEDGSKYMLPKIYIGDTVAVTRNAKLRWFTKESRDKVLGRTGKVVNRGKYVYTVNINGKDYHFSRIDLKRVV